MKLSDLAFPLPTIESLKLSSGLEVEVRNGGVFVVAPGPYNHLTAGEALYEPGRLLAGDLSNLTAWATGKAER